MWLQLLGVVFGPGGVGAELEEAFHVVKVFTIRIVQGHPDVLDFTILGKVNR